MKRKNRRRRTPIPYLALSMHHFNALPHTKADYARLRAILADRLIAVSYPVRERVL